MTDRTVKYIEWKLRESDYRVRRLQDRFTAIEQKIMYAGTPASGSVCKTSITGSIIGGQQSPGWTPMPNTKLKVVGHQTATVYGTFDVPTGEYNIDLTLDPADTQLRFSCLGPSSPRFSTTYGVVTGAFTYSSYFVYPTDDSGDSIASCEVNSIPRLQPPIATNVFYIQGPSTGGFGQVGYLYPVYRGPINVSVNDSVWGDSYSTTCQLRDTYATDVYPSVSDVPSYFARNGAGVNAVYNPENQFDHTPATGTCPNISFGGWSVVCSTQSDITSETHPGVDYSTLWQITWNCSDQMFHNGSGTIQFYEDPP